MKKKLICLLLVCLMLMAVVPFSVVTALSGGTVSGTSTSFGGDDTAVTTIQLYSGTGEDIAPEPAYETTVTGTGAKDYVISGVASGTYTLKVTKAGHITREYTITVGSEDVTQDLKVCIPGDINGDGYLDSKDVLMLRKALVLVEKLDSYGKKVANLYDKDQGLEGVISAKDLLVMRKMLVNLPM